MDDAKIREIGAAWQNETDEYVLRAASEDIDEYPPEVRIIIRDEAVKRGLLKYELSKPGVKGLEFEAKITDKGKDILIESEGTSPRFFSVRVVKTCVALCTIGGIAVVVGFTFGLPESVITAIGAYVMLEAGDRIWASRRTKPRNGQKQ